MNRRSVTQWRSILTVGAVVLLLSPVQHADAAGCQWEYYSIFDGQLQPAQPLFNDPDNTPILSLSVGRRFKGNAQSHASLASTGSTDFDGAGPPGRSGARGTERRRLLRLVVRGLADSPHKAPR